MFNIGPQELLLILLVALVVVGPKRLPELSRTIGRGLREFRKAQDEVKKTINLSLDESEPTGSASPRTGGTAPVASAAPTADRGDVAPAPEADTEKQADTAADVARTLGRGLAEIRRARREIQRTFRVDLTDEPPGLPSSPSTPAPSRATDTPAAETSPAETPRDPQDRAPAGPERPA
ncbi:MAG TPA: twin-arginine translocase TatA/TatE family subunit [Actinomycetota bacterium]|nr:twin-arginine translocase TatA/TatE family subunit [Actinomycetota bacterium]